MATYMIARYDIENPEEYMRYALAADSLLEKHGGELLVADDQATSIEGQGGCVSAVVAFDTQEAAMEFYNDPDYQALKKIRLGATTNGSVVIATSNNAA